MSDSAVSDIIYCLIFSGGKFEFRKGQDLVVRAVKVLQERHRDVALVAAWHNYHAKAHQTMTASPYVRLLPAPAMCRWRCRSRPSRCSSSSCSRA